MAAVAQNQSADARQRILEASGRLFAERGFDRVTYDDIAESAAVSKSTIYKSFEEKIDILSEYAAQVLETPPRSWYAAFTSNHSLENTLIAFGTEYLKHLTKPEVMHVYATLMYFSDRIDSKSKACICILPHNLCEIIKNCFLKWDVDNKVKPIDHILLIYQFTGMLRGTIYPRAMFQENFKIKNAEIQRVVRQSVEILLHGLAKDRSDIWG